MSQRSITWFFGDTTKKTAQGTPKISELEHAKGTFTGNMGKYANSPSCGNCPVKVMKTYVQSIEDSPVEMKKRKRCPLFDSSDDEDQKEEVANPPPDIIRTPNGTIKRKTARKSILYSKKPKLAFAITSEEKSSESDQKAANNKQRDSKEDEMGSSHFTEEKPLDLNEEINDNLEDTSRIHIVTRKEYPKSFEDCFGGNEIPNEKKLGNTGKKKAFASSGFFKPKNKEGSMKDSKNNCNSPAEYDPSKNKYHPINDACWEHNQKVPYLGLAKTFKVIEATSSRLKIIECLSNFYQSVIALTPKDLLPCIYLSLNRLAPAYEGIELGVGENLLIKAVAETTGRSINKIKADAKKHGDLGVVAETSKTTQKMIVTPPPLDVCGVLARLKEIASITGSSSINQKLNLVKTLLVACKPSEARYLIRSLEGKLRIGLAEQSVLVALAYAATLMQPGQDFPLKLINQRKSGPAEDMKVLLEEKALIVKTAYCVLPNYDMIIGSLLKFGIDKLLEHCKLTPGIPLKPMLAHPTKGVAEVLNRFDKSAFTCEYKYDGERAQIHVLEDSRIEIYSRNQERSTSKYPDIIARMPLVLKEGVKSCVIDSEAVAWDTEKKQILPFQVLSTRKRKDAHLSEIKVQVCIYAFDLLFLNGQSLVRQPLRKRRGHMLASFNQIEGEFLIATSQDSTCADEIAEFLEESIKHNCEGLMVKTLDDNATYEIAKRSRNWLKLKKDYLVGVGDTLDLLVIGGYHGKGRRTGTYGGFLLACYDDQSEEYQTICKESRNDFYPMFYYLMAPLFAILQIGTGFNDQDLTDHANFFKDHISGKPKPYYRLNGSEAEEWFEPVQVWEVKAADLSISPVYAAGIGIVDPEKGISLRFPRFVRVRNDKKPEDVTTSSQVADMYYHQEQVKNQHDGNHKMQDADFY